ncbi:MAG: acyltransferase [Parvibaculum sp.]|nr:acyltransferase [Parvibaculum sp.]
MQKYRADIDGLRALAVVPVVLFHAGIPGFTGGYVGVDVFFVISGYLITSILVAEIEKGSFSIAKFYERRIRRLLPALFTVIAASSIAAFFFLLPDEMKAFGRSVVATILFASNFLFWKEAGYFDSEAESKPLLHTWSLAVEEQFYIVFPIALLLCYRLAPRLVPWAIGLAGLLSFVLAVAGQTLWPEGNFYLAPPRAWELMLGAILALNIVPSVRHELARSALALSGIIAICLSIFLYDNQTPFPGPSALLPTVGAALIIYAGLAGQSSVGSWLAFRPLVFIGLVSYSFYLWHWPVLVYARMYAIRDLTLIESTAAIVASFVLAVLSWRHIERPFRERTALRNRRHLFATTFAGMAAIMGAGILVVTANGLPWRMPEAAHNALLAATETEGQQRYRCATEPLLESYIYGPCPIGADNGEPPAVLIWGDSHAMALQTLYDNLLRKEGESGVMVAVRGCSPVFDLERVGYDIPCSRLIEKLEGYIERTGIQKVVLVGAWREIFSSNNTTFEGHTSFDDETRFENVRDGLHSTVVELKEEGVDVAIMLPAPGAKHPVPHSLVRSILFGREADIEYSVEEYRSRLAPLESIIETAQPPFDVVIEVEPLLCGSECVTDDKGQPLYYDADHPSQHMNRVLLPSVYAQLHEFLEDVH